MHSRIFTRPARAEDLAGLAAVRYAERPAIHRDRIAVSDGRTQQYVVAELEGRIVGFGLLLIERPAQWSDPLETFPILVDLFVHETARCRGGGQALIHALEAFAAQHGKTAVYLNVEPQDNARALALYRRLGYQPLQTEPVLDVGRNLCGMGPL